MITASREIHLPSPDFGKSELVFWGKSVSGNLEGSCKQWTGYRQRPRDPQRAISEAAAPHCSLSQLPMNTSCQRWFANANARINYC